MKKKIFTLGIIIPPLIILPLMVSCSLEVNEMVESQFKLYQKKLENEIQTLKREKQTLETNQIEYSNDSKLITLNKTYWEWYQKTRFNKIKLEKLLVLNPSLNLNANLIIKSFEKYNQNIKQRQSEIEKILKDKTTKLDLLKNFLETWNLFVNSFGQKNAKQISTIKKINSTYIEQISHVVDQINPLMEVLERNQEIYSLKEITFNGKIEKLSSERERLNSRLGNLSQKIAAYQSVVEVKKYFSNFNRQKNLTNLQKKDLKNFENSVGKKIEIDQIGIKVPNLNKDCKIEYVIEFLNYEQGEITLKILIQKNLIINQEPLTIEAQEHLIVEGFTNHQQEQAKEFESIVKKLNNFNKKNPFKLNNQIQSESSWNDVWTLVINKLAKDSQTNPNTIKQLQWAPDNNGEVSISKTLKKVNSNFVSNTMNETTGQMKFWIWTSGISVAREVEMFFSEIKTDAYIIEELTKRTFGNLEDPENNEFDNILNVATSKYQEYTVDKFKKEFKTWSLPWIDIFKNITGQNYDLQSAFIIGEIDQDNATKGQIKILCSVLKGKTISDNFSIWIKGFKDKSTSN